MQPLIVKPFSDKIIADIQVHVREVRRMFEGRPCCDAGSPPSARFNRYHLHNPKVLVDYHQRPQLTRLASRIFGEPVKPSYVFLAMYTDKGICPGHTDRPQCRYTLDLCISQDKIWNIMVGEDANDKVGKPYRLREGEALAYSGSEQ